MSRVWVYRNLNFESWVLLKERKANNGLFLALRARVLELKRHRQGPEHHSLSPWRSTMKAPQAPQQSFSGTAPGRSGVDLGGFKV